MSRSSGNVRAVVFDLDGTLVDSRRDIAGAARHALREHGAPDRTEEEIVGFVGDGARVLVARALGLPEDSPAVDPVLDTFLRRYEAHPAEHTVPMPRVVETLEALSRLPVPLPLAICTNKPRRVTIALLDALDLARRFAIIVAGDDLPRRKPDPLPLHHIAASLGVRVTELALVGDGVQDVRAGRAAGAFTIAVLGGFTPLRALQAEGPDALIERIDGVLPLVFSSP